MNLYENQIIGQEYGHMDCYGIIPDNVTFNNTGYVSFYDCCKLPNIVLNNYGHVHLISLNEVHSDIIFNNHGHLYFNKLVNLNKLNYKTTIYFPIY